jgi:hypothetical protein
MNLRFAFLDQLSTYYTSKEAVVWSENVEAGHWDTPLLDREITSMVKEVKLSGRPCYACACLRALHAEVVLRQMDRKNWTAMWHSGREWLLILTIFVSFDIILKQNWKRVGNAVRIVVLYN